MSSKRIYSGLLAAGAFCVLALAGASPAKAGGYGCWGWGGGYFGNQTGFGVSGTLYGLGKLPVPPYYSIHPPVYYSYPVARPYGYSPHAAPSIYPAVEVERDKQVLIRNMFYKPSASEAKETSLDDKFAGKVVSEVEPKAKMIINPFYREQGQKRFARR